MRWTKRMLLGAAAAACAACSSIEVPYDAPAQWGTYAPSVRRDLATAREATAAFRSLDAAVQAGYPESVPQCIRHADHGAMGYHHMNRALMDARIEVERPEILLYSRTGGGEYVLNGVEYIVPYSVRPRDAAPPTVMDQPLKRSDPLGIWYLHVWLWTENPSGLFADWNPAVECSADPRS
ncbi:MAG TPA: hypothetical protein VFZ24_12940 [Longimicrobiales bacterium]